LELRFQEFDLDHIRSVAPAVSGEGLGGRRAPWHDRHSEYAARPAISKNPARRCFVPCGSDESDANTNCLDWPATPLANSRTREPGPRPTLGELQRTTPWVWLWCESCQHHAPLACAVAVIRWGPNASSDRLRISARFTSCGGKGATLQRPGWAGNHISFEPFPTSSPVTALLEPR
jgi:hypothetical protein